VRGSAVSKGDSESESEQFTDSYGESDGYGTTSADSTGTGGSIAHSESRSTTWSPMLIPLMGQEASPPQFRSVEEQVFRFTQRLSAQRDRQCTVRLAGTTTAVPMVTRSLAPPLITRAYTDKRTVAMLGALPYALPMDEALRRLDAHEAARVEGLRQQSQREPTSYRRRVEARVTPPRPTPPPPRRPSNGNPRKPRPES
jgi:hypothetical protein